MTTDTSQPLESASHSNYNKRSGGVSMPYLVLVRANKRLVIVVREEPVFESEVAGLPAREVLALLHEVTLPCRTRYDTRHNGKDHEIREVNRISQHSP